MVIEQLSLGGCCKDCPERYLGCHDHCEKYQMAHSEWVAHKKAIKAEKDRIYRVRDYEINRVKRMKTHKKTN